MPHQVAQLAAQLLLALGVTLVLALLLLAFALVAVALRAFEAAVQQFLLLAHHLFQVAHHARGFLHVLVHLLCVGIGAQVFQHFAQL